MTEQSENQSDVSYAAVDLSNCDREPIHILGRVQSFGALVSVSSDWIINHASTNISDFLDVSAEDLIGQPFVDWFPGTVAHEIRTKLQVMSSGDAVERLFGIELKSGLPLFDLAVHVSGRSIIIELEPHPPSARTDYLSYVRPMIERVDKAETVETVCDAAVRQLRALTGFDRVMVYKFLDDESGTVISEATKSGMETFKGLRYPASDIPKQARALYLRNLLRIISDVSDEGHAIIPATNPEGEPLDLSLSTTRAVSPIHLEYLKNMGVNASMSISIIQRGKLWGLFACHHETPKILSYDLRTATELFGQLFSFVLSQRERDEEREEAKRGRILHDQLMAQMAEDASIADNFDTITSAISSVIPFDGAVGWIDGEFMAQGQTPTREEFKGLVRFLNTTAASRIYAQSKLSKVFPAAEDYAERAAGLLVLPVSRSPRDYIVLFRKEIAKTVTWAGNPEKPVEIGPNGVRLTPRKSFEAWTEMVRHESAPWTPTEINSADALRMTLLEVVLRMTDASNKERARSQERQELLIAELNHRVRNILNLIRSLIAQTNPEGRSTAEFTDVIGGRIHALARAHDQITQESWSSASVRDLIQTETDAYLGEKVDRIQISGPDVLLEPTAFTTLSLVIHELVTNSVKYGALCDARGSVQVELAEGHDGAFTLNWREVGGPPIQAPPERRGFGTTIIERSIPYELKGDADVKFEATGLRARFTIPSAHVAKFTDAQTASAPINLPSEIESTPLSGDVLLVEDNMIIALDAEDFLGELGATTVHVASRVADAQQLLEENDIRFALLDVNLGSETSEPIASELVRRAIPFVFATGYGDASGITKSFPDAIVIQKPYTKNSILDALQPQDDISTP